VISLASLPCARQSGSHVQSAEPCFHRWKITNEVVGRDVDAYFAGAGGDEENGAGVASTPGARSLSERKTLKNGISGDKFVALLAAHGAGERGDVAFLFGEFAFDPCGSFHRADENKDGSVAVFVVASEVEDFVANCAIVCLVFVIFDFGDRDK